METKQEIAIELTKQELRLMKEQNEKDYKSILDEIESLRTAMDRFIENADKKYASKLTEIVVYALCGAILLAVLYSLLNAINLK